MDLINQVTKNPVYSLILLGKTHSVEHYNGLERIYYLSKSNKHLKTLKESVFLRNDLSKLDHNKVLDLYPEYEYIFGPYADSNSQEVNLVYILFTNRINQDNEALVLYANRVLKEHDLGHKVEFNDDLKNWQEYVKEMDARERIPGKLSNICYYRRYEWTDHEKQEICRMYGAVSVKNPRYNSLRENFICGITLRSNTHIDVNVYRLLYELYHAKKKLGDKQVVSPINGKKADLRIDNVMMRDLEEEDKQLRQEVFERYGLDTYKLEQIYAPTGFNRFRGVYVYDGKHSHPSHVGRRYVKLVQDGTDFQHTVLLSRALVAVKLGRVLSDKETVDHIDHNSENDVIDNLRIIPRFQHSLEDSVYVEVDPITCGCCGKKFIPANKLFSYLKLNPKTIPYCTPKCLKKIREMDDATKEKKRSERKITYRYYMNDKTTGRRKYFPDGLEYAECRKLVMEKGEDAFVRIG